MNDKGETGARQGTCPFVLRAGDASNLLKMCDPRNYDPWCQLLICRLQHEARDHGDEFLEVRRYSRLLAEDLGCERSTVEHHLRALVRRKLVRRITLPGNPMFRRILILWLPAKKGA